MLKYPTMTVSWQYLFIQNKVVRLTSMMVHRCFLYVILKNIKPHKSKMLLTFYCWQTKMENLRDVYSQASAVSVTTSNNDHPSKNTPKVFSQSLINIVGTSHKGQPLVSNHGHFLWLWFYNFPPFSSSCKWPLDSCSALYVHCIGYATQRMKNF